MDITGYVDWKDTVLDDTDHAILKNMLVGG